MKRFLLLSLSLLASVAITAQTFTIRQNVTGMSWDNMRGQSFTPQVQGSGTGDVGDDNTVFLEHFSFVFASSAYPEKLYLYSELPSNIEELDNGTGGILIAESISMNSDDFLYTRYFFDYPELEKDQTYYVLFRQDAKIESGGGNNYTGGGALDRRDNDIFLHTSQDLRFEARFTPPKNSEANIVTLTTPSQVGETIIDLETKSVTFSVPASQDISSLQLTIEVSENGTYSPMRTFWNFSSGPVTITVTSESGTVVNEWTVIADKPLNTDASMGTFFIDETIGHPEVDEDNHTIKIVVSDDADLSTLIPYIYHLPFGATVSPAVEVPTDFSEGSVVYTVTAEDGETFIEWTVTVVTQSQSTSIKQDFLSTKIYPSIVNDLLVIENQNNSKLEVTIFNVTGHMVYSQKIEANPTNISMSHLPSGIYLIKLSDGLIFETYRVIRE
ncbi:T9SS type A sorting domain-containing protein [Alkalitalea saponilacus]|uniref:Por secretion system C-terminal sorting domain-containing protein n=1 Tax=Alkalitalea saponilacus TaxID=889453 RepID=A0A1T5HNT4_9BACT|nr:T9SS type A sorting domain-containing protein [Alkalitalea saponilacus]ASB49315.1 hypothetical protein CDL62_09255 [Alkalitalea saponilacus]SKC22339.1 Por secretion system C-terminal sorting domain-containing protein [Alkalitalea saponilacus]